MRLLRKTLILGLAGLGAYRVWELLSPKLDTARGRNEPAWSNAKEPVGATTAVDLTREESNASGTARSAPRADSFPGTITP